MISISEEKLISLAEACSLLPRRPSGRQTHPGTIHRWASSGVRGVKLETIRIGGSLCTSVEALQRFFDRLGVAFGEDSEG